MTSDIFVKNSHPFDLFAKWFKKAKDKEMNDPNAMALSSVDGFGMPNVRMVLLKDFDERGFVFYTNLESAKGKELIENKKAAVCFYWKSLSKQIRIRGKIHGVSDEEADRYFQTRSRSSRIGAWASEQSRPMESRFALEKAVARYMAKYAIKKIPRPPHWSGLRIVPETIEFWEKRPSRLHKRIVFTRVDDKWSKAYLYP